MFTRRLALSGILALACALPLAAADRLGLTEREREASIAYIDGLQNEDGGFRAAGVMGPSVLSAVTTSTRALKHLGGEVKHKRRVEQFVNSCFHGDSWAFSEVPGGLPDVRSTAMGLMSMAELKMPLEGKERKIIRYLEEHARDTGDLYISEAAMAAAGLRPEHPRRWIEEFERTRNADGTYGKAAADTARAVITRLRLKEEVPHREAAVRALKTAQNTDGGWSSSGSVSDLATCYPVMRALHMLKEKPRVKRLREFVASCRNRDGGYGPTPGKPSTTSATYQASIILDWLD